MAHFSVENDAAMTSKMLLTTTIVVLSLAIPRCDAFGIVAKSDEPVRTLVGADVELYCKSSAYFEYCNWRREGANPLRCNFEWKRSHDAVKKIGYGNT